MTTYFVNAAPMIQQLGTEDLSTRRLIREPDAVPQHLPKFFLYTQKGPETPNLVSGAEAVMMYGDKTFDPLSPYYNHATAFAKLCIDNANSIMVQRVKPAADSETATFVLWLDTLQCDIMQYERNDDGTYALNEEGNTVVIADSETYGYKIRWSVTEAVGDVTHSKDGTLTGARTVGPDGVALGTPVLSPTSTKYPLMVFTVSSFGEHGNSAGFRMWAPENSTYLNMPHDMMEKQKAYPYFLNVIKRPDAISSPKIVPTILGDQELMVTLKPGTVDPDTAAQLYMGDIFLDSYQNLSDPIYPKTYGDFGSITINEEHIQTVVDMLYVAEKAYYDNNPAEINMSDMDFDDATTSHLYNFVSGRSSTSVPYFTLSIEGGAGSIYLNRSSNIYALGGADGTMSDALFATLVDAKMDEYLDPMSIVQEDAINVESIIYDSGFPIYTKKKLANIIALRKDTFVVLSTHESTDLAPISATDEHSTAVALRAYLQMFPESEYFGTPVMRGMIIGRSGKLLNNPYKKRLPLTAEFLIKACRYMGAGTGIWNTIYSFDGAPYHVVENMYDISITWVPASVRNVNWSVGLNWVQAYDRRQFFFPAYKTIYPDDTSVLNSFFTAMAICQINKVTSAAWREFSGVEGLTRGQLADRINAFISERTKANKFDNRYHIVPAAYFTDADIARGYSVTVPVKIYANNMMTVMTSYVQAYRMEDYVAAQ